MFILGLSNPVGDADYFLTQLFHSSNKGLSGNRTYYDNAEVDRLLDEARQEIDETKRLRPLQRGSGNLDRRSTDGLHPSSSLLNWRQPESDRLLDQ